MAKKKEKEPPIYDDFNFEVKVVGKGQFPIIVIPEIEMNISFRSAYWDGQAPWNRVRVRRKVEKSHKGKKGTIVSNENVSLSSTLNNIVIPNEMKFGVPKEVISFIRKGLKECINNKEEVDDLIVYKLKKYFNKTLSIKRKVKRKRRKRKTK